MTFVARATASSSRSDDDAMSVTSWRRSDKEIDAVPTPPFGLMGVAGDLCVARRRRCPCIAFSLLLDLASQAPSANIIVFLGRDTRQSNTYNKLMAWVRFCSFWIYPSLACLLLFLSLQQSPPWKQLLWLIPWGWFIWSLLEYALHRFFFHWIPHHRRFKKIIRSLHVSHHGDSRNPDKILVRPIYSLPVSALFLGGFYTVTGSLFAASALLTGLWLGFLYYELVHYRLHLSKADGGLLEYQRQGHFYHHFVDSNHCFGVTSPLWDWVFGTYRRIAP